jgi:poly-gamma-glutamate synthesis protein (capsule biosynthesis protein)
VTREALTLFLCGDVMLGRGVDQILPRRGDARLREDFIQDAREYVRLAEAANGAIPRPVDFSWPWGEALHLLDEAKPDARIVNLETSVTAANRFAPGKGVHYRMNPANTPCLRVARPDVCVLANNHVLDFGREGLRDTLDALRAEGLRTVGAGRDQTEARRPAIVPLAGDNRVIVRALGMSTSGVRRGWAARADRSGIDALDRPTRRAAESIADDLRQTKRVGDVAVVSIHWGPNWGYEVTREEIDFAHTLIDGGVDVVYGHSSHHPRPIERYRDRLVLYGCGDFIDDYEGIGGFAHYRDDLRLAYFARFRPGTGELESLRMVPFQAHRMRLRRASHEDTRWLRETLDQISAGFGVAVDAEPDDTLSVRPR